MNLTALGNFFLAEWLWSVTWGLYHIPLAILCMFILFRYIVRLDIVPSVLLSFFANLFALAVFNLLVVGVLFFGFGFEYTIKSYGFVAHNTLQVCLYLGFLYGLLHMLFFSLVHMHHTMRWSWIGAFVFVTNVLVALSVHLLVPTYSF